MDAFQKLNADLSRYLGRRIAKVKDVPRLHSTLSRAWVRLVQQSAKAGRKPANAGQIVRKGGDIGWKVWGSFETSEARLKPRLEQFMRVVDTVVTDAFVKALK